MQARLAEQPFGLSATATHDTKRGEDARARIYAISEMPEALGRQGRALERHARLAAQRDGRRRSRRSRRSSGCSTRRWPAPGRPTSRPTTRTRSRRSAERMQAYMLKVAARGEAPHQLDRRRPSNTRRRSTGFVARRPRRSGISSRISSGAQPPLRLRARSTSLAQLAIKLAAPGVPDIYQGTEFWDLSFVDPDNRRPVDFAARQAALAGLDGGKPRSASAGLGIRARRSCAC